MNVSNFWKNGEIIEDINDDLLFSYCKKHRGWVYIANNSLTDFLKIGFTKKTPLQRMKSLDTAGVIGEFTLLNAILFVNAEWAEARVHQKLSEFRVEKEFFNVNFQFAYSKLMEIQSEEMVILSKSRLSRNFLLFKP